MEDQKASRDHAPTITSGKGTLTLAALTAALLVSGCGPTDREVAQGAYDYGVYVGRVLGLCQHLREIYEANPDSDWAHDKETVATIATCRKAEAQHGPGTRETIHVPAASRLPLARDGASSRPPMTNDAVPGTNKETDQ
jgi:hypothetical protein